MLSASAISSSSVPKLQQQSSIPTDRLPSISEVFESLEQVIRIIVLTALTGRHAPGEEERAILSLPCHPITTVPSSHYPTIFSLPFHPLTIMLQWRSGNFRSKDPLIAVYCYCGHHRARRTEAPSVGCKHGWGHHSHKDCRD